MPHQQYKLFIDDLREPPTGTDYIVARSSTEAIGWVVLRGIPQHISFDHDLGGEDTSMVFLHWLANKVVDVELEFPEGFTYTVHSQNPVGAQNIRGFMGGLIKFLGG
jgi:hypothetical protein